jgi:Activator of Hsp90 ATPase homolog 1-like protein
MLEKPDTRETSDTAHGLDTVVTWTLARVDGGTRLRLVHSGFVTPKNDASFGNSRDGWTECRDRIGAISGEQWAANDLKITTAPKPRRPKERNDDRPQDRNT